MPQMNGQRRDNAIRLLTLFTAAGVPSRGVMRNAWVFDIATQNGLDDQTSFHSQNWLKVGKTGFLLAKKRKAASSRESAA
jgi:hypothetical protein